MKQLSFQLSWAEFIKLILNLAVDTKPASVLQHLEHSHLFIVLDRSSVSGLINYRFHFSKVVFL